MLLCITLTEPPATDLGYLLHKHPDRLQSFAVSAGQAHVFYPEAAEQRCTAALLLEIDPIALVRGHRRAGAAGGGPDPDLDPAAPPGPTRSAAWPTTCWPPWTSGVPTPT